MKNFDNSFLNDAVKIIAGTDEAGRGPLAGPVVAAAVVFKKETVIEGINDSKKLSEKKREELFPLICKNAASYAYEIIQPEEIDRINILQASLKAMKNSVEKLTVKPDLVLIDGNKVFQCNSRVKAVVKGDSLSFSIAAASIIAKVVRDSIMKKLSAEYPVYHWEKNKGYPTREHILTVQKFGATPYHRKSFLKKIISDGQYELG